MHRLNHNNLRGVYMSIGSYIIFAFLILSGIIILAVTLRNEKPFKNIFLSLFSGVGSLFAVNIASALTAVSCYLLVREIQKTHGNETAVFLLMMVFLYYRLHSGIAMSENFGIALAAEKDNALCKGCNTTNGCGGRRCGRINI
jgi:hypothetical protein